MSVPLNFIAKSQIRFHAKHELASELLGIIR